MHNSLNVGPNDPVSAKRAVYDARGSAGSQRSFRDKLGPMLGALYDERIYRAID